ncbi:MAG: translation initiation factor IF-2 [Candidatus Eisenbacteria bacterium]|nr:translation initiation factor IF-2 [Candidatus Eisenbacteria bacterium]
MLTQRTDRGGCRRRGTKDRALESYEQLGNWGVVLRGVSRLRKVRVYQLARELKVDNESLLGVIQEIDPAITSHKMAIEAEVADQVRERMAGGSGATRREPAARGRTATRTATPRTPKAAAPKRRPPAKPRAEEEPLPAWGIDALPKAPEVGTPVLQTRSAPLAPPPARPMGSAIATPGEPVMGSAPTPTPQPTETPTRTYRPDASRGRGGRGGRPGVEPRRGGKKGKRKKKRQVDEREVLDSIRRTMATIDSGRSRRKRRKTSDDGTEVAEEPTKIRVSEFVTVAELASAMQARPAEVVAACLQLGIVANVNRRLDRDAIETVADEFGFEVEIIKEIGEEILEEVEEEASDAPEEPRPPIVTVMGHVDHGKTKLLDYIRESDVVAGESGGITQHIGASAVHARVDSRITFLDTPGHEAFTAMRARGADVTDIVVLVVAADDRVNEQTLEAINHAKAARKPIVVAINKVDLANADPEKIKKQLADQGLLVEDWGGDAVAVEVSAKTGQNVDKLLEMILLVSEMLELKAQRERAARGTVIVAKRETGRGIVSTVLIQNGTIKIGDPFVCGVAYGKVRAMYDDLGQRIESAGPSTPVEVLGWSDMPQDGDSFAVVRDEAEARSIAARRGQAAREHRMKLAASRFRLENLHDRIKESEKADLRVVIKGDVQGSVEVLRDSLEKLSSEQVNVVVIHTGVGKINESDVLLATASNAVIIGFHVRPDGRAIQLAQTEDVDIRLYSVIYEVVDEVKEAIAGLLKPKEVERIIGTAEVREVFQIPKVGTIAGCRVVGGKVTRAARARVIRGSDVLWTGRLASLKRFKDDAREVASGYDCGIGLDGFDEIHIGDQIEAFVVEEAKKSE